MRTRRFLLQPTARQRAALERLMETQRELYNAALEHRRGVWRWERRPVSRYEHFKELKGWAHPVLEFGVVPARGTLTRLDRAFAAFYRRCRAGATPGFPRFKGIARFHSVEYGDTSCWAYRPAQNRVYFLGIGHVKFAVHQRYMRGAPKTCVLRREGRRFFACVVFEVEPPEPMTPTGQAVGIDLGVEQLLATSGGEFVTNPRYFRQSARRLAEAQRLMEGRKRGSHRRRRAAERVGAVHRKIARQRHNLHHELSKSLVARYDVIVHEDLAITNMSRRPAPRPNKEGGYEPNGSSAKSGLNREILAAGWGQLLRMLSYKAEEAGRELIAVDPRHTSMTCHVCGHIDGGNRRGVLFRCLDCGHSAHADINAAQNILRAGLARRQEREATNEAA